MKFARFTYATLGLVTVGSLAWGCSDKANDCKLNLNCGPYDGGAPGASGASGSSGKGGSSGKAGNSGNGGDSGLRQEGGSAGDEGGASGVGGNSGTSGNAGSGGAPCTGTASPDTAQCVIGDEYGLFVSLAGDDATGDGTEAKPLATVTKALSLTGPGKLNRVYVCSTANGSTTSYAEPDTLVIPDRVSIYGGFTCVGGIWEYDTTVKAWLKPVSPVGAIVNNAQNGVTVQDLRIDAMNAPPDGTGASSFGMVVKGSKAVRLTRVEIRAGKGSGGAAGANGGGGADGDAPTAALDGAAVRCSGTMAQVGKVASTSSVCGSLGGNGGTGFLASVGGPGTQGTPDTHLAASGKGLGGPGATAVGLANPGADGTTGSVGLAGINGASASGGKFTSTGYTLASGGAGTDGFPGQGGGGGGASMGDGATCFGASGAAGGMGGCGGGGGGGGIGGGASVALLSWSSEITIEQTTLISGSGGAGGNGGAAHVGGAGQSGGKAGAANLNLSIAGSGQGGAGGPGGHGGNGAAGNGGPSIALVYSGTKPVEIDSVLTHPETPAPGGLGGQFGSPQDYGPNGTPGVLAAEYEQK